MQALGVKAIKLTDLYLDDSKLPEDAFVHGGNDSEIVAARLAGGNVAELEILAARCQHCTIFLIIIKKGYCWTKFK